MVPPPPTNTSSSSSRPPPRSQTTLPPATTASAKAARSAFFCQLCQKGYSRINEFENHENSYDHQHKKRLKEMKEMQRVVQSTFSSEKEKDKEVGLVRIKLGSFSSAGGSGATTGGGFKKGGFKNAFAPVESGNVSNKVDGHAMKDSKEDHGGRHDDSGATRQVMDVVDIDKIDDNDDDSFVECDDYYDPARPTDCMPGCQGVHVST